jgi:SAM-dependent methyltransferase
MYSTRYSELLRTFLESTDQKAKTVEAIKTFVLPELHQHRTFADLGCGSGEISEALIPFFQKSILADLDASNISKLVENMGTREGVCILQEDLNTFVPDFRADLILFSFSLGYLGAGIPECDRFDFRVHMLNQYFRHLNPGGKMVIVDTTSSGAYRNLFDFLEVSIHREIERFILEISTGRETWQHAFEVTVKTRTIEEMVLCLRLITYDDGSSRLNLIPRYLEFCHSLPREDGMFVFRYTTVLTMLE